MVRRSKVARLVGYEYDAHRVGFRVRAGSIRSDLALWYPTVDLARLARSIGRPNLERILAHMAVFELGVTASLGMEEIDLGRLARHVDPPLQRLWARTWRHVWAQWRYEHARPAREDHRLVAQAQDAPAPAMHIPFTAGRHLAFFGGGKDSLVGLHLLEAAGIETDIVSYTSSVYGSRAAQVDAFERATTPFERARVHTFSVIDETADAPIVELYGRHLGSTSLLRAETPCSLFEALPIVIAHGYRHIAMFNERTAGEPNLHWPDEDLWVNHQWAKSPESRRIFSAYVRDRLVSGLEYYSPLEALSEPAIFVMLARLPWAQVRDVSSCNIRKPWCRRCPKCVYVWLSYLAYLDPIRVRELFGGEDLFAVPEVRPVLAALAGRGGHVPFECVGQAADVRIALALCRARGLGVGRIDDLLTDVTTAELRMSLRARMVVDPQAVRRSQAPARLARHLLGDVQAVLWKTQRELDGDLCRGRAEVIAQVDATGITLG